MARQFHDSDQEIWRGRPWILPYLVVRTSILVLLVATAIILETFWDYLYIPVFGITIMIWNLVVILAIWILWIAKLIVVRSTNLYVLRVDSLEIKTGVLTTKNSVIVPSGFSDLEVIRSVFNRILNTGNITIKTQSEKDYTKKLIMVKDPMRIAKLIRDVMARQNFKLDELNTGRPG